MKPIENSSLPLAFPAVVLAALLAAAPLSAVLPEPDHTIYGTAFVDDAVATTGTATLVVDGEVLASYDLGSDPALGTCDASGCLFALRVPMDQAEPVLPGRARTGDDATLFLDGVLAGEAVLGEAGEAQALDLDSQFAPRIPGLVVLDASGSEALAGPFGLDVPVTLRLSFPAEDPVTVDWSTADGDASSGADYDAASGTATFDPGETTATVTVTLLDDALPEADPTRRIDGEAFFVELSNPTEAVLLDPVGKVTILDDDTPPALSVSNLSVVEPPGDAVDSAFTVRLSHAWDEDVSFSWTSVDGTAGSSDYELLPGAATILAGDLSTEIPVRILSDADSEGEETFTVQLADPVGAVIRPGGGRGTILSAPRLLTFVEHQRDGVAGADDLFGAIDLEVSPDGRHVYVASRGDDALTVFEREDGTGRLAPIAAYRNGSNGLGGLSGIEAVAVSPAGDRVYAAAFDDAAVAVFERHAVDGTLTLLEIERSGQRDVESGETVEGLEGAIAMAVAAGPSGEHLYVAGSDADSLAVFSRDPVSGLMSYSGVLHDDDPGIDGLGRVVALAMAPGGEQVYAASFDGNRVTVFERDPATGELTFLESHVDGGSGPGGPIDGLDGAAAVAVSSDGTSVYVAGQSDAGVAVFERQPDGTLIFQQAVLDGVGVDGLALATDVAVSQDGSFVYGTGFGDDALVVFQRAADGTLTQVEVERDDIGGIDGLDGATSLAVSLDDLSVYATGTLDDAVAVFRRDLLAPAAPAEFASTSHDVGVYSNQQLVGLEWSGAVDEDAGTGVGGYVVRFDSSPDTLPDASPGSGDVFVAHGLDPHDLASEPQPDGDRYAHLLTCDHAGNCTASHAGPFPIDATPPSAPFGVDSPSHGLASEPTSEAVIDVTWSGAVDALSGLAAYGYAFTASPTWSCEFAQTLPSGTLAASSAALADGSWYFHLCASDVAGNLSPTVSAGPFLIDTTAPANPATFVSTSHQVGVWSPDDTIDLEWSGSDDANGLAGYSLAFDQLSSGTPDDTVDVAHGGDPHTASSPTLADGDDHYVHLATCDLAGNCASPTTLGPFAVDTTTPSAPTAITSSTHTPGVPSSQVTVAIAWDAASDAASGVAGYAWEFTTSGSWTCDGAVDGDDSVLSTTFQAPSDGSWYFHLCVLDAAGNASSVASLGPFVIETAAPVGTLAASTSHQPSAWSSQTVIEVEWSATTDPNGVAGYSFVFDTSPSTVPDEALDLLHGSDPHSAVSAALADGDSYYFHLRSCDVPGNCSGALHLGPFWIETVPPSSITGLLSTSHPTDDTSTQQVINVVWDPSSDATSGVDGYGVAFDQSPTWTCDEMIDVDATQASSPALADGTWYAHVCAADEAGNWTEAASAGPYAISTAPAIVTGVATVADTGDGRLDPGERTGIPITQLAVDFSRALADPAGDSDPVDVTNPDSWKLMADGGDGVIETTDCDNVAASDVEIVIERVDYFADPRRAQIWFIDDLALGKGRHRLFGCAAGLHDEADDPLDGDADGIAGGDFGFDFTVLVDNLLRNPNLDEGLDHWMLLSSGVDPTHDELDADDLPTSGSVLLPGSGSLERPSAISQCVTIDGEDLALHARVRIDGTGSEPPTATGLVEFFADAGCQGDPVATFGDSSIDDNAGEWFTLEAGGTPPPSASSALVSFIATWPESSVFDVYFDVLFVGDSFLIFSDDFESGDTRHWSIMVPPAP